MPRAPYYAEAFSPLPGCCFRLVADHGEAGPRHDLGCLFACSKSTTWRVQTNVNWEGFGWAGRLAVSVSTLVVGMVLLWLAGRGAARILEAASTGAGPAIGWGLLVFFSLPILAVLALVTLVGIPLGVGTLAALGLIYAFGYAATAWILGRLILREPAAWILAFLVGWGILRLVALVPILGGLTWFGAVVFGLGVLAVAIWRARAATRVAPAAA